MATPHQTSVNDNLEEDSNLLMISSNGFKYLKDIEADVIATSNVPIANSNEQIKSEKKKDSETKEEENEENKMLEIFGTLKINNDITFGLGPLEFEAAIDQNDIIKYRTMRMRCHASYVYACAHADYFIAVANKFKRNAEDIRKNEIKIRNTRLLNENQKLPGLWIGIIGAGRLGRQLAYSLLEFGDVNPSELRISTRQPDILGDLKEKGVECFFDNRKLATTVNVLFICVLPHQLQSVIDEIRPVLPKKCIIYSLVRTIPQNRLKNLIKPDDVSYIFKPSYTYNSNTHEKQMKWNFSLDIIESLYKFEMFSLTNPLCNRNETIVQVNEFFIPSMIYALLNVGIFLKFNKSQCVNSIKSYMFPSDKQFKFDEGLFIEPNNEEFLKPFDINKTAEATSKFLQKFSKSKGLQSLLSKNYIEHFDSIRRWKTVEIR